MSKKLYTAIVTILLIFSTSFIVMARTSGDYEYKVKDGQAYLTRYLGSSTETTIEVPEEIEGYTVVGLVGTFKGNQNVENIILPDTLKEISGEAFSGCKSLKSIDLPDSLKILKKGSFTQCDALEEFTIPKNVVQTDDDLSKDMQLVSGSNLKKITNLSNSSYGWEAYECQDTNYTWFLSEDGYEVGNLDPNSSVYRREKSVSMLYRDKYLRDFPDLEVSMLDMNTEEEILEYILSKNPVIDSEDIECEVMIKPFVEAEAGNSICPEGFAGRASVYFIIKNKNIVDDKAQRIVKMRITPVQWDGKTELDVENIGDNIVAQCIFEIIKNIPRNVDMEDMNTGEEVLSYIESFFDEEPYRELYDKYVTYNKFSYQPAVAGTKENRLGTEGNFSITFWLNNSTRRAISCTISVDPILYRTTEAVTGAEVFAREYKNILKKLAEEELTTETLNRLPQIQEYITSLAPTNKDENIEFMVSVSGTEAINGTYDNIYGEWGEVEISVFVSNKLDSEEYYRINQTISIMPIWYTGYDGTEDIEDIDPSVPGDNQAPDDDKKEENISELYAQKYQETLKSIIENGVSINTANTPEEIRTYILSLAPTGKAENLEIDASVNGYNGFGSQAKDFKPAVNGTWYNRTGTIGKANVVINVSNKLNEEDSYKIQAEISIIPVEYTYHPSNNDKPGRPDPDDDSDFSSDNDNNRPSSGNDQTNNINKNNNINISIKITITNDSVYAGTWIQVDGKWKIRLENGIYANSQWARIDSKWYLMGQDGNMVTGWQQTSDGRWYLFDQLNGDMKTGWQKVDDKWYLLDTINGDMKTGWNRVGDKWYLLGQDGVMKTGWNFVDGKWYFMNPLGDMVTGWKQILGKYYYMNLDGSMLLDAITPDGYRVNKDGEWIP